MSKPTKKELLAKIAAMGDITEEQRNEIVCALIGHSRIVTYCFGYVSCGRCRAQVGDTLAGAFDLTGKVIVGHKCEICEANFKGMGWRDKLHAQDPFPSEEEET